MVGPSGNQIGRVSDCVVRLVNAGLPTVTGILLRLQSKDVYVSAGDVLTLGEGTAVQLSADKVDVRPFDRRPGEVLLDRDVCGRAVIDVARARLIRVSDLILEDQRSRWHVAAVLASPPPTLAALVARLLRREAAGEEIEWRQVAPLVGHVPTAGKSLTTVQLANLKPAEIADIVEAATHEEGEEILEAVSADEELEADVFEELDEEHRVEFLKDRSDAEAAEVLANMGPDLAADLLMQLPQERRRPILEMLPAEEQRNVRALLGYGPDTAGGLMSNEFIAWPDSETVAATLQALRLMEELPAILTDIYVTAEGKLAGSLSLAGLLRADMEARLGDVMQADPEAVYPDADLPSIAVHMADFNLATLPVIGPDGELVGVVTYDDLIQAMLPEEWRWRGRPSPALIAEGKPAP